MRLGQGTALRAVIFTAAVSVFASGCASKDAPKVEEPAAAEDGVAPAEEGAADAAAPAEGEEAPKKEKKKGKKAHKKKKKKAS